MNRGEESVGKRALTRKQRIREDGREEGACLERVLKKIVRGENRKGEGKMCFGESVCEEHEKGVRGR